MNHKEVKTFIYWGFEGDIGFSFSKKQRGHLLSNKEKRTNRPKNNKHNSKQMRSVSGGVIQISSRREIFLTVE